MKSISQQLLWLLFLVLAVTLATTTPIKAEFEESKFGESFENADESISNLFVQSFKYLHRRPFEFEESTNRANLVDMWIEQKVDHFNDSNTATWQMRYIMDDLYYKEGGPIFISLGGEWAIMVDDIMRGHFVDIAKEHNGMLYVTEHRFYGKSKPTSDISTENLQYLHVKQALADVAHFIEYQRKNNPSLANSKVIMAGGSYSATMVVWFKRLYPEILTGGWASSAPLLAKVDFKEYKEVAGLAIVEMGSQECYDHIDRGITKLERMLEDGRAAEVKAMFKLCDTFDENNDLDVWSLFATITNIFAGVIQYQKGYSIESMCKSLTQTEDEAVAIAKYILLYSGRNCMEVSYKDTVDMYSKTSYLYGSSRPWFYQTCNEYGWYQTSTSRNQPFGSKVPSTFFTNLCEDVFGEGYTNSKISTKVAQTNLDFGGLSPNVENIYETHGALDPWNAVGHTAADGATIIPKASHCADMDSISLYGQSKEMRESKEKLMELVSQWLAD